MKLIAVLCCVALLGVVVLADLAALPHFLKVFSDFPGGDKLGHFLLMGGLARVVNWAFPSPAVRIDGTRRPLATVVVVILVVAEEFSQMVIPARSFSLMDLAADLLGIWIIGGGSNDCWAWAGRISVGKAAGSPFPMR